MEVAAEQRVDGETRGLAQHVPACHVQGGLDREVGLAMILKLPSVGYDLCGQAFNKDKAIVGTFTGHCENFTNVV